MEREPTNTEELTARTRFRSAAGGNDFTPDVDAAFWRHWDGLKAAERADMAALDRAAFEAKPRLAAARAIAGELQAAERNFLAAGGTPEEWRQAAAKVREELLHKAAMSRRNENAAAVRAQAYY